MYKISMTAALRMLIGVSTKCLEDKHLQEITSLEKQVSHLAGVVLKKMIEYSTFTNCFFSSMHASNYFSIRGRLPQEKKRMIGELETVLGKEDPSSLRPEFTRGL